MPLWLIFVGAKLKAGLSALLGVIGRHPWQFAVIALCALSAWLWHGKRQALERNASILAAQKHATADQVAVNHEPARKSAEIAKVSNDEAPAYYEEGRRAGLAYAASHRVRISCPVSSPDLLRTDSPQPSDDGPGVATDMVAISTADFNICTTNSTRLARVHADAGALIEAGVAVNAP